MVSENQDTEHILTACDPDCLRDIAVPGVRPLRTGQRREVLRKSYSRPVPPASIKRIFLPLLILIVFQFCQSSSARASEIPVGRLLNPQGSVTFLQSGKVSWEAAQNGQDLFAGDSVKTGQDSRAAILCIDETQLKLNQNTIVVLKGSSPSPRMGITPAALKDGRASLYEVQAGEIWLRNKNEKAKFEVRTPAVTAAIRGTEFNLKVDPAGATSLVLLEGRLSMANPQGQIDLDQGEEGFAEIGRAPVKRVVLQPKDAVQWSLYYPGTFSCRDIPLSAAAEAGTSSAVLINAKNSYDRGDLDAGERDAGEVLASDPENGHALLILGWIYLQRQNPQKAIGYFERARKQNAQQALTVSGLALAAYGMGDVLGAYRLMTAELQKGPATSLTLVMTGYFAMLAGKIGEAEALVSDNRISGRESAIAHSLLSQIYLVQNSKEKAFREATAAMQANGESPMARMSAALVRISYFDLPEAMKYLNGSLAADPHYLDAYVYLARLWLGADYLDRAWEIISRALEISKTDSEVLSIAGFIRLGYRDYDRALTLFNEAVKNNPAFGEPHIGLANIAFRNRNFTLGLTEMLTATLLEPRVSLYQSSLGKALYQTRSFDKALEVYDYAKTLDPNDPTPYLYKGIALFDLYRPGEAIQEINKSIELNDNMAVFRSRFMLDRDLAVRNTDLANAYYQLGMSDWAYSKALTAVKKDPLNASAHLFLCSQYASTGQRVGAASSELLLYWLLAPANENTFSFHTDYTQMFEMPYTKVSLSADAGTWASHQAPVQDYSIDVLAGMPGFAVEAFGDYNYDPGFRKTNDDTGYLYGLVQGKYEPTFKDSLYASYTYYKLSWGDTSNSHDYSYATDRTSRWRAEDNSVEGGFVHRFTPEAVFIGYFNWGNWNWANTGSNSFSAYNGLWNQVFYNYRYREIWDSNNLQLQQQLKVGDHTFLAGFEYITGSFDNSYNASGTRKIFDPLQVIVAPYLYGYNYNPPDRTMTFHVHDYWSISPQFLVELGVSGDLVTSSREGPYPDSISSTTINPSVGLNYEINKSNTLRLAYQGYTASLATATPNTIAPSEVAGFPSLINTDYGSKVKELGFSWESQWNAKTFGVLRLNAYRVEDPQYDVHDNTLDDRTKSAGASFTVNRLLTSSLGLSAAVSGKVTSMDSAPDASFTTGSFNEIAGTVGLYYMHPKGWFASINDTVVSQDLGDLSDKTLAPKQNAMGNPFNLVDFTIGKYFDNKRGYASLTVTNIFNQHFYYQSDPLRLLSFYPDREILFTMALYF